MKKCILMLFMLLTFTASAQTSFTWNKSFGVGIGYSHVYNTNEFVYNDEAVNLFELDCTIYGFYVGVGMGWRNFNDYYAHDNYMIGTYSIKLGPSFSLNFDDNNHLIFTPFAGVILHNQSYDYFTGYYNYYTGYYGYDSHVYEKKFLAGGRISYVINTFEIGAHVSNYDFGVTIGINFNCF